MAEKLEVKFLDKKEALEQTARGQITKIHSARIPNNPLFIQQEYQKMYATPFARIYKCDTIALPDPNDDNDMDIWYCLSRNPTQQ